MAAIYDSIYLNISIKIIMKVEFRLTDIHCIKSLRDLHGERQRTIVSMHFIFR